MRISYDNGATWEPIDAEFFELLVERSKRPELLVDMAKHGSYPKPMTLREIRARRKAWNKCSGVKGWAALREGKS